ncbi:hypothetical protein K2173_007253 [Erythroxylum novogranatense]|uniref:Peroxisomal ATPase PEX6 n=1 Tax=Erythroxylum novogranatense TaxID=1862640 RepID=A0AAV8UBD6_9ROSI|nr:hypothetical protein K2173_007253 [Erythroxylum novogranatense]
MVGRGRRPLLLSSTKVLLKSVLNTTSLVNGDSSSFLNFSADDVSPTIQLRVGILRLSNDKVDDPRQKVTPFDDSALIGLSTSVLKRLTITSGSLVIVKNVDTKVERFAQVVVLDPPRKEELATGDELSDSCPPHTMLIFPSYGFPSNGTPLLDKEIAYVSPLLAFNLDLHVSCLKALVRQGNETLASLFESTVEDETCKKVGQASVISLELKTLTRLPSYASHLRVSFVKIPECGTLEALKGRSLIEAEDRQEIIDLALQNYFKVDRYLARGDIFNVCIFWNCNSTFCIPCQQRSKARSKDIIYFKVMAMEPSDEAVLRVNHTQTALVLGGAVPSAIPPDLLIEESKSSAESPLQRDTVKILGSIFTPSLCPSALFSKFRVAVLLHGVPGCGKRTVVRYVARRLGLHVVEFSCHNFVESSDRKTSVALSQAFSTAQRYSPTILLLRHFDVFHNLMSPDGSQSDQVGLTSEVASVVRKFTEPVSEDEGPSEEKSNHEFPVKDTEKITRHQVLLVAAAQSTEGIPPTVRRCFSHEIGMSALTEEQRFQMLSQTLQNGSELLSNIGLEDTIKDTVAQTSGFMPRDLQALVADAGANIVLKDNAEVDEIESQDLNSSLGGIALQNKFKENLSKALDRAKKRNASALGTPKVPNVKWEDVGGLEDVKKSILDTVQLPLLHKDLFSSGLRKRSGILLYGPPGTGKTLLAKAVATECSLNFLSVKGPELINMYIGESEKNIRDIFQKARSARPCVIFFDELDSLAPARGASGDSGGVMDRVVSQMLAEIDGLNDSAQDLFIIGASNRPDLIDPALLRPGRFDKLLYVGVNSDASYRERVLEALTRKFTLHQDVSLYSIAKRCPANFTGADMYALCADAWFHAAKRKVLKSNSELSTGDQAEAVVVQHKDFVEVLKELSPSLSTAELKKYELLRDQFEGAPS